MLARMGAMLELEARPARNETLLELKELYIAREALMKDRTAAKNRGKVLMLSLLKRQNAQRLEQIERQIMTIEAAIFQIVEADVGLSDRLAILISIPGVSNITAFALLIEMPELGVLEAGQAASLVGLAPIARQSGRWTGRAFIRGGRASVRRALYMPALVATRFNPDLKAKYRQLVEAGKPAKVALIAIMRKLIVLANALLKANRKWAPKISLIKTDTVAAQRRGSLSRARDRHQPRDRPVLVEPVWPDVRGRHPKEAGRAHAGRSAVALASG